jgi:hypothetical protein
MLFITGIVWLMLLVFFLMRVVNDNTLSVTRSAIWGTGIIFLPLVTMPLYYYLYIWRVESPD